MSCFLTFSFAEEWRQRRRRSSGRIGIGRRGWRRRCCGATDRRLQPGRRWVEWAETAQGRADTKASRPATTETAAAGISHFFLLLPLKRAGWHFRSRQSCGNGSRWNWRCDPSCWSPIPTATSIIWMRWCRWLAKSTTRSSRHSSVRCIIDLQVEIPERSGRDCRQDKKKRKKKSLHAREKSRGGFAPPPPWSKKYLWSTRGRDRESNKNNNKMGRKTKGIGMKKKKVSSFCGISSSIYLLCRGRRCFFFSTTERRSSSKISSSSSTPSWFSLSLRWWFPPSLGARCGSEGSLLLLPLCATQWRVDTTNPLTFRLVRVPAVQTFLTPLGFHPSLV